MRAEYPVLILFAALGMGIMASARDLMTLYVGLELNSLAAYVPASFMRTDDRSSEAGLKYFVLGSLASRSEEHTSELQSLMRISYAVFCLKKKNKQHTKPKYTENTDQ